MHDVDCKLQCNDDLALKRVTNLVFCKRIFHVTKLQTMAEVLSRVELMPFGSIHGARKSVDGEYRKLQAEWDYAPMELEVRSSAYLSYTQHGFHPHKTNRKTCFILARLLPHPPFNGDKFSFTENCSTRLDSSHCNAGKK